MSRSAQAESGLPANAIAEDPTARIASQRHVTAAVALDTIDLLAERAGNLLTSGRRMTLVYRYVLHEVGPDVHAGLTLHGTPRTWRSNGMAGFGANFDGGLINDGISFATEPVDCATEAEVWARYHGGCRRSITIVELDGGFAGDTPAKSDQLRVTHWNEYGVGIEWTVAFDYRNEES